MAGKKRSGLINDSRAYRSGRAYNNYYPHNALFTISYNGNVNTGGVAPTDGLSPYTSGTTVTVLGNTGSLVKSGYTFFGWNTEIDGSGSSYLVNSTFSMPSYNVTLYAEWISIVPKTLTYNGNGSTGGNVPTDGSSPYTTGSTVTVLGNSGSLVKTDYLFAGWNTATDGSGIAYIGSNTFIINANTILYAQWIIVGSRLIYNAGTGGSGLPPSSSGTYYTGFSEVNVVNNIGPFTNGSFVFGGWNTLSTGLGINYPPGSKYIIPNINPLESVTLYAQWIDPSTTYTLTYNANSAAGGSGIAPNNPNPTIYNSKSTATILGNTGPYINSNPSKIFYQWNTAANGTGTNYIVNSILTMAANITLYAQWVSISPSYLVTYDANGATGGSVPATPTTYPSDVLVSILGKSSLIKAGYIFLGWNSSSTGAGSAYNPGYTFMSKTVTLYALWAPGTAVKSCPAGILSSYLYITYPFAQIIKSDTTITIYTVALFGSNTTNYGSGAAPEGLISLASKLVITQTNITINTNTTYLNSANDYNYSQTIINGIGVTYWPSGATISSITFPTITPRNSTSGGDFIKPPNYNISTRRVADAGCGIGISLVFDGTYYILYSFSNQGITLNYSDSTNTQFISSPTISIYTANTTILPIIWSQTPRAAFPYANITPRSSAALTAMTIIPSTGSYYINPVIPDFTVQYDGNGATGGSLPAPQYMSPYTATTSVTINGNTGLLTNSSLTFSRWNTSANGSGINYGPGYTTTYNGSASIILYAIWI